MPRHRGRNRRKNPGGRPRNAAAEPGTGGGGPPPPPVPHGERVGPRPRRVATERAGDPEHTAAANLFDRRRHLLGGPRRQGGLRFRPGARLLVRRLAVHSLCTTATGGLGRRSRRGRPPRTPAPGPVSSPSPYRPVLHRRDSGDRDDPPTGLRRTEEIRRGAPCRPPRGVRGEHRRRRDRTVAAAHGQRNADRGIRVTLPSRRRAPGSGAEPQKAYPEAVFAVRRGVPERIRARSRCRSSRPPGPASSAYGPFVASFQAPHSAAMAAPGTS